MGPGVVVVFLAIVIVVLSVRVAQEYQRAVVFRLGRLAGARGPGLFFLIPLLERAVTMDLRTNTVSVEQQESITRDSVTIKVNAVLRYKIADPKKAVVEVRDYRDAVYQVALTSLRNIIGQHVLDEVLKERDAINTRIGEMVNLATAPWGVTVQMVEMKDVEIPESMQRAMAREAEAMREKRARLIKAEAESEAAQKLVDASRMIADSPMALELRRMQMVTEVGAEHNTTTIVLMPSDFVAAARAIGAQLPGEKG